MPVDLSRWHYQDFATSILQYDSVWTSYAANHDLARRDVISTVQTAMRFIVEINNAENRAADVLGSIRQESEVYREIPKSLRQVLLEDEIGRVALEALAAQENSVESLVKSGRDDIAESTPEARDILESDLRSVFSDSERENGGYLPPRFLCGLAKVSMGAGLLTVWIPPHAHAIPAVALGGVVFKKANCKDLKPRTT